MLASIEWLKTRHRAAFWAGTIGFAAVLLIGFGSEYYFRSTGKLAPMSRPGWSSAGNAAAQIGMLIMLVTIVLLTSSERTWRTERQNVIDGLSRNQYFFGKLILMIGCSLLLWAITLLSASVFEMMNRSLLEAAPPFPFMRGIDATFMAGVLLYLLFVGSLGLLFGITTASSGSGLALGLLFLMLQPLFTLLMVRLGGVWHELTAYMPMQVMDSLSSQTAYDAARVSTERIRALESGAPLRLSAFHAALVAGVYSVIACGGALLSISRRDL